MAFVWICNAVQAWLYIGLTRIDYTPNRTLFPHYSIMSENRIWMYQRLIDGFLNLEFVYGVEKFLEFACAHSEWIDEEKIKCSYRRSKC